MWQGLHSGFHREFRPQCFVLRSRFEFLQQLWGRGWAGGGIEGLAGMWAGVPRSQDGESGNTWLVTVWDCLLVAKVWQSECTEADWRWLKLELRLSETSQCEKKHPKIISPPHFSFETRGFALEMLSKVSKSISSRSASRPSFAPTRDQQERASFQAQRGRRTDLLAPAGGKQSRAVAKHEACWALLSQKLWGEALQCRTAKRGWRGATGLLLTHDFSLERGNYPWSSWLCLEFVFAEKQAQLMAADKCV